MHEVEYIKGGSDPEFSFGLTDDKQRVFIHPADKVVGGEREVRMRSFIGTDGHANTAELRPPPCHNVYWHMIKIADALKVVRAGMAEESRKLDRPVVAVAQPSLGPEETMGGHVWVSMWYHSKLSAKICNKAGMIFYPDHNEALSFRLISGKKRERLTGGELQDYTDRARMDQELTVDLPWKKMHYLIWPLELMLFGTARQDRSANVRDKYFRFPDSLTPQDLACMREDAAYLRFEYRIPTSWLSHPMLAYGYLGLAKLAIQNWYVLPDRSSMFQADQAMRETQSSNHTKWAAELLRRLDLVLEHKNARVTKDLKNLREAINILTKTKLRYPCLINFDAWADLKPQRG